MCGKGDQETPLVPEPVAESRAGETDSPGIDRALARSLTNTNMIESMIGICRTTSRNVKRRRDEGDMRRRWCAAGMLEAERKFHWLRGHRQMPQLATGLARHAETVTPPTDTEQNPIAA